MEACKSNEISAKKDFKKFTQTHDKITKTFQRLKQVNKILEDDEIFEKEVSEVDEQEDIDKVNQKFTSVGQERTGFEVLYQSVRGEESL